MNNPCCFYSTFILLKSKMIILNQFSDKITIFLFKNRAYQLGLSFDIKLIFMNILLQ